MEIFKVNRYFENILYEKKYIKHFFDSSMVGRRVGIKVHHELIIKENSSILNNENALKQYDKVVMI